MLSISFLGTGLLITELGGTGYVLEMLLLIVLLFLGFSSFYGLSMDREWAESMASFYYAVVLINLIILIFPLEISFLYTATIIVSVIGFGISLTGHRDDEFFEEEDKEVQKELETYEGRPKVIVEDLKPAKVVRKRMVKKKSVKKVAKKTVKKKPVKKKAVKKKVVKKPAKKKK